ncbi:molybdenum cofactor guanylyltransferase [Pseudidiomarina sp. YC-516-91]|uniref:molybdenum cofactor guanylyltransferase n=1 Tax=Pseudidiomarina salilacus TaxID=3384452 RepID=UPI003984F126
MQGVTGIVVAGGASSRMGQDKALLQVGGCTQLDRTVQLLKSAGCQQVVVSRNADGFVSDTISGCGPLGGVLSVLPHCLHELLLIVPVDMPLLACDTLLTLIAHHRASYFSCTPLPCLLPNNEQLQQYLVEQLQHDDGDRSVRGLLTHMQAQPLEWPLTYQLQNTNTPQQWRHALQFLGEVS